MKHTSILISLILIGLTLMSFACAEEDEKNAKTEEIQEEDKKQSLYISYHPNTGVVDSCLDAPCEQTAIGICPLASVADHVFLARIPSNQQIKAGFYNEDCSGPYQWPYVEFNVELTQNLISRRPVPEKIRIVSIHSGGQSHGATLEPGGEYLFSVKESEGEYFMENSIRITRIEEEDISNIILNEEDLYKGNFPSHIPTLIELILESQTEQSVCSTYREMIMSHSYYINFDREVRTPADCTPGRQFALPSEDNSSEKD